MRFVSESVHGAVCALVLIVVVRIQCRDGINMQYLKRTSTGLIYRLGRELRVRSDVGY